MRMPNKQPLTKFRLSGKFAVLAILICALSGCMEFSRPDAMPANINPDSLVATSKDMRLILERSCSESFSRYMFMISNDKAMKQANAFGIAGYNADGIKASITSSAVEISFDTGNSKGTASVGFCGGEQEVKGTTVKVTPAVVVPSVYVPSYLASRGVTEIRDDGSMVVQLPSNWSAEKKLLAYMDARDDSRVKTYSSATVYGQFTRIPELVKLVAASYDRAKGVGENLYVMRVAGSKKFALLGLKEK